MDKTLKKLQKLHRSVQQLETALHEVWSGIEEIGEDERFSGLMEEARQYQSKRKNSDPKMEEFCQRLDEFEKYMEDIPEDGTTAEYFDDAIAELIAWIEENR
ncbi:hypothetical protein [Neobacillus sp. LXY-4]|uniref:hypothetical protein n=1 Tax=Neobacillus sp. LXY-4 TaxID=3379826 RepID=UPI003EE0916F